MAALAAFFACLNCFLAVLNFTLATLTSTRADLALDSASAAFVETSHSLRASVMTLVLFFITSERILKMRDRAKKTHTLIGQKRQFFDCYDFVAVGQNCS